jgi:hypothetical protein
VKLITKSEKIKNIVEAWSLQYGMVPPDDDKYQILQKLKGKKPTTEKEIAEIIGNVSWTRNSCDQCKKDCDLLVELGQELDYESATARICKKCLSDALSLFDD